VKNIVFLLCLLCLPACGSSSSTNVSNGSYSVSGTVKMAGSTALAGATVTFTGTSSGTASTASDGTYSFTGVNNGVYQISSAKQVMSLLRPVFR
jgi:protocatechuate 3,4-dioxygenase beta subunit